MNVMGDATPGPYPGPNNPRTMTLTHEIDGRVVGVLQYASCDDESRNDNIYISEINVLPVHRRKGIATQLIKRCLAVCSVAHVHYVTLWTGYDMEKDCSWVIYNKLGFQIECYLEHYYEKGVGTRLFSKRLN